MAVEVVAAVEAVAQDQSESEISHMLQILLSNDVNSYLILERLVDFLVLSVFPWLGDLCVRAILFHSVGSSFAFAWFTHSLFTYFFSPGWVVIAIVSQAILNSVCISRRDPRLG